MKLPISYATKYSFILLSQRLINAKVRELFFDFQRNSQCPGGEVETLGTANPSCAGSIPAQDSRDWLANHEG